MCLHYTLQGTFGREPQAKPEDDRYLRAAIQEYDNVAKLGQIMREGPVKVRNTQYVLSGGSDHTFLLGTNISACKTTIGFEVLCSNLNILGR